MAQVETGVFVLVSILAFGFMAYSLKMDLALAPILRLFSVVLFFAMGLFLVSGY